nr:unnamed protein product [Trichobilharzia regenti]
MVPSTFLKYGGEDIPILLLKLFSTSLSTGTYPDAWKTTHITPRYKSGSRSSVMSYRPINLTSVISRVLEKIVKSAIFDFLSQEKLITPYQHGFMKSRSCTTCHLQFFDHISQLKDSSMITVIVYLDLSKAFDTVSHRLLISKVQSYGIQGSLLSWLSSFLSNRMQMVRLGSHTSNPVRITSGVIQGSVLGPLLFLLYFNDICDVIKHGRPFLFADDIKIVYHSLRNEVSCVFSRIQDDIESVQLWCNTWKMKFNVEKCGVLCSKSISSELSISLHNKHIPRLPLTTDLGLKYTPEFSLAEYVKLQVSKVKRLFGFLFRNFKTSESKIMLYKLCVRPLLEFCPPIMDSVSVKDRCKLESLQRAFTKRLVGDNLCISYYDRCNLFDLEPLWVRRLKFNLKITFRIAKGLIYFPHNDFTFSSPKKYNLRNKSSSFKVPRCHTKYRSNSFTVRYRCIWNRLPTEIRDSPTPKTFSSLLNKYFINNGLEGVCDKLKIRDLIRHSSDPHC